MNIFISHIVEEGDLALILKAAIQRDFLNLIKVFVSSDRDSVLAGQNWLTSVDDALTTANIEIILCSSISVRRPWINFEAGAGWMRRIPVIPFCHSGMKADQLPMPLAVLNSVQANDTEGLKRLYTQAAKCLGANMPEAPFEKIAGAIVDFEKKYEIKLKEMQSSEITREETIRKKLREVLDEPEFRWRSIERLASKAAISIDEAADLLRTDPEVVFGKGKKFGKQIVRLAFK